MEIKAYFSFGIFNATINTLMEHYNFFAIDFNSCSFTEEDGGSFG